MAPLPGNSTEKERKIYELVLKRFGAASYSDCIFEVRAILTKFDEDLIFPTMGRVIIIETLLARSYVRREKRRLQAMQKGVFLIDTLKKVCIQKEKEVFSLSQAGV